MSSISSLSTNNMNYLLQVAQQTAKAIVKSHSGSSVQQSFSAAMGDATAGASNPLTSSTLASLINGGTGSASASNVLDTAKASLLNIMA